MVIVQVSDHHVLERSHAIAQQRFPESGRIGGGVDKHGVWTVPDQNRVALPNVHDDHRRSGRRARTRDDACRDHQPRRDAEPGVQRPRRGPQDP